ncbi:SHOCT domain-containing protein [Alicyclobacillus sp. ALC3]|uniref:SHOCT domain-containing protein n=1 Tax=Alicyclobacillus sp. ALC3 TaxID=2796143 RepID=UPI002379E1CD|nr:SHOCT domain-containing protein [Alicyclobacillus sp. ALC3]WDL98806.1 SHOCT domain-containing protein [Alicyclobacillus sp. ALC3]
MMYGFAGSGWYGWLSPMLWIVILVAVVYLVVYVLDKSLHRSHTVESDAAQILRERFARGEIDAATFSEMKKQLKQR